MRLNPFRPPPAPEPAPLHTAPAARDVAAVYVEHGRWLANYYIARADNFEKRANFLMAFSGGGLTLALNASARLTALKGPAHRVAAAGLIGMTASLLIAVACSIAVVFPRRVAGWATAFTRSQWGKARNTGVPNDAVSLRAIAEVLWRGNSDHVSLVVALEEDGDKRSAWFKASALSFAIAVVCFGTAVVTYIVNTKGG